MQFIIHAYDGTDEHALERRMAVRQSHLDNLNEVKKNATVCCAGGILDDAGKMIGSFMVMDFETKEAFDSYLATEPYVTGNVWQNIKVDRANVVIQNNERVGK